MTNPTPTTVAIPMHASAPFVDVISANIEALPHDVEIILSDHTVVDDALDRLQQRHGDDHRIRFVRARDGIGPVDHYNRLLRDARGEYFMWMPHDDSFPADYIPLLRHALDGRPDAILAFGSIRPINLDGELLPGKIPRELPIELGQLSRAEEAIRLRQEWNLAVPYRGLMRRREVLQRRLFVRRGLNDRWHDFTWVFAMTVVAPIVFVPGCVCEKRYHPESHHAQWSDRRAIDELTEIITVGRYMMAARVPLPIAARVMTYSTKRGLRYAAWKLPESMKSSVPQSVRRATGRLLAP